MARQRFFRFSLFSILFGAVASPAQMLWYRVDTLTQGAYDCFHPSVIHNDYQTADPSNDVKVVFERHTATTSDIVVHYGMASSRSWFPFDVVISSTSSDTMQTNPDIGEMHFGYQNVMVFTVAAWQRWDGTHWQIWYSERVYNPLSASPFPPPWSAPRQLSGGQENSENACVRRFSDTSLIVVWRQDSAVVDARISPTTVTATEALGVAPSSDFAIDAVYQYGQCSVLWTDGHQKAFVRRHSGLPQIPWSSTDSVDVGMDMSSPRFIMWILDGTKFLFDSHAGSREGIFMSDPAGGSTQLVLADSNADLSHASAYAEPIMIIIRVHPKLESFTPLDLVVFERTAAGDSALVFLGAHGFSSDTIRSVGHNRNAVLSSSLLAENGPTLLTVWESNRSGRSQIYARWAHETIEDVPSEPPSPEQLALYQNYPNPFNPTTVLSAQWTADSRIRLAVYDLLGREVAVLADGRYPAGKYSFAFDGSRLASGVYYYELRSGETRLVRSMALVK